MSSGSRNPAAEAFKIWTRLFNHRPFLKGEVEYFVKNFQDKRGDREIENIFAVLERVSELRDFGVDRLEGGIETPCNNIRTNLQTAESLVSEILLHEDSKEVEQTLLVSREAREKELKDFSSHIQRRYLKIDEDR
ncbi:biogenesis of lysosome-related organelles complex 1 subunit 5 isoform X2 [Eurytemora carolleeae]|uniref:biogenesis of lysosome-related organelles complex 1 subunit 5 isoform X2 n=1 Tax=Eurytemora carolleeae TaxID=1294199 RepID=UPI000C7659F7|nr:biogenesis of lysosome-related organelles complex 1 subunit 5 isoform X2 [Eurytemora carolleeae]|eukprot:XP_023336188.1 biogenesis of lysosome-related organelles complex 1 subunit 5-like isoform X2 [Eurytemora affinis]